ncbi:hypothetical protein, partial [Bradyrhizobium sp.]|uniref:hypothetical protein n=1 Tax=Bradyrhizobium sp. TaxID=376 RepID=UPI003C37473E
MPKHLVDFLEAIEIDAEDGKLGLAGIGIVDRLGQTFAEGETVGQIGQRIKAHRPCLGFMKLFGQELDRLFRLPAVAFGLIIG